jgi:hypothetical protein
MVVVESGADDYYDGGGDDLPPRRRMTKLEKKGHCAHLRNGWWHPLPSHLSYSSQESLPEHITSPIDALGMI